MPAHLKFEYQNEMLISFMHKPFLQ